MARRRYKYSREKASRNGSLLLLSLFLFGPAIYWGAPLYKLHFGLDVRNLLIAAACFVLMIYLCKFTFKFLKKRKRDHIYRTSRMFQIDRMNGDEFKRFLAVYFRDLGYRVKRVGGREIGDLI